MEHATSNKISLTLLGLGGMGTALARTWLAAGHPLTVWNRTAARAEPLAAEGAHVAATIDDAVAAGDLVVVCLLDDASVGSALDGGIMAVPQGGHRGQGRRSPPGRLAHRHGAGHPRDRRAPGERRLHRGGRVQLAMMVEGNATLLRTAEEQGVSPELLTPFIDLLVR